MKNYILGLAIGFSAYNGSEAVAQAQKPVFNDSTITHLRDQALDMSLSVLQDTAQINSVKRNLGKNYTAHRRGEVRDNFAIFKRFGESVGIYTLSKGLGVVNVQKLRTSNIKEKTEIVYEPEIGNPDVIAGFSMIKTDSSDALVPIVSQTYVLQMHAAGPVYQKTEDKVILGTNKTGRVVGVCSYDSQGRRDCKVNHFITSGDGLVSTQATKYGVYSHIQKNGSVITSGMPDTSEQARLDIRAMVHKALGDENAKQIEPFFPQPLALKSP